jgi:hypothetical protein
MSENENNIRTFEQVFQSEAELLLPDKIIIMDTIRAAEPRSLYNLRSFVELFPVFPRPALTELEDLWKLSPFGRLKMLEFFCNLFGVRREFQIQPDSRAD